MRKRKNSLLGLLAVFTAFLILVPCLGLGAPQKKINVLMIGFGEPSKYDANAMQGWKNFLLNYMNAGMNMLKMSFMYPMITKVMIPMMDTGTILIDKNDPFATTPKPNPQLIDAWTRPYNGKDYRFISVPEGEFPMLGPLFSYYLAPGGPGKGEPDFWEYVGLTMYEFYRTMDNYNPGGEREDRIYSETEKKLREQYGSNIVIDRGFGAARPGYPHFQEAAQEIVKDGATELVLAQNYVCFSEFENPAGEIEKEFKKKGIDVNTAISGQIGGTAPYNLGVAKKANEELVNIPKESNVVVFLSHHGMFNVNMGLYDWTKEPYHEYAKVAFEGAKKAISDLEVVRSWDGKLEIWQVYAEFASGQYLSIDKAAALAIEQGFDYVINIPFEVGNSGFETLIGLRGSWEREPGNWDEYVEDGLKKYKEEFNYNGLKVIITDGWIDGFVQGYVEQTSKAIDSLL